jgi:dTDP-glucose 4,6-dehydratase
MRALVAGGAGMIGSRLCEVLIEQGDQVVCLDNLISGSARHLLPILDSPAFELVIADASQLPGEFIENHGRPFDAVFHLAVPTPLEGASVPLETLRSAGEGTRLLLEIAQRDSALFILGSSGEVYGTPEVNPQPETYYGRVNPIGPRSASEVARRYSEALATAYERSTGTRVCITRIFDTYGPRQHPAGARVLSTFMRHAFKNEPLVIRGDGLQTRSFCYVDDIVNALVAVMRIAPQGPINLGSAEEITISALAHAVIEVCGSRSSIVEADAAAADVRRRCPDITRAKNVLGWRPYVLLREGLERTVAALG